MSKGSVLSVVAVSLVIAVGVVSERRLTAQPPPAAVVPDNVAHGKTLYEKHCVECHGVTGKGDGPAAHLLVPRPRDFTSGRYKIHRTETGSIPVDEDLVQTVRSGMYGTSMPGWSAILADPDVHDVVQYIKTFSPRFATEQPQRVPPSEPTDTTLGNIPRGAAVYEKLQCGKCHGTDGRGAGAVATEFEDDWKQPLNIADLTEPWTFRGGPGARDIFMRFRAGMSGTPMPSFKEAATDDELWLLAAYVVSLGRKPAWAMDSQELAAPYAKQDAEARANPGKRGRYRVDTIGCAVCHSPVDENRRLIPGLKMAGGMRIRLEPFGDYPAGNLTSDKETGLGNWTDDEIKRTITKGILKDGTRLLPFPMDWPSFSTMRPEDLDAMVVYLRTIPPVSNKVPRPSRKFLPLYLWGKFDMLLMGGDQPLLFFSGNAGTARPRP